MESERMVVGEIIEVQKNQPGLMGQVLFKHEGAYTGYDLPTDSEIKALELAGQKVKVTVINNGKWLRDQIKSIDAVKPSSRKA